MQKIMLPILLLFVFGKSRAQFNQQADLKTCNITIKANPFTAVTFIELEFYNPRNTEVEAFQALTFDEDQVVTGFQLELNGKYRDGSIEEKWKATNAYNRIVGKRIDPALLSKHSNTYYTLNIYPVPALGSRKVTITLLQKMKNEQHKLTYNLPLLFTGNTSAASLNIMVNGIKETPQSNAGLIEGNLFGSNAKNAFINTEYKNIVLNKPVSFSILLKPGNTYSCVNSTGDFLLRLMPEVKKEYALNPRHISVVWDVSKSGQGRDITKEINFLSNYLQVNKIKQVDFIAFNHTVKDKMVFDFSKNSFYDLFEYIRKIKYTGATLFSNLDFSQYKSDALLLFSDGRISYGNSLPQPGAIPVSCIYSSASSNMDVLQKITGNSGGKLIPLVDHIKATWIDKVTTAENYLIKCISGSSLKLNTALPLKLGTSIFLSGKNSDQNEVKLVYGNNSAINKTEVYALNNSIDCDGETFNQVRLLESYDSLLKTYPSWDKLVVFGINNKIVTTHTSYIVLERIEDYITYKIAPPKELEEKCAEMNYVYNSEFKINAVKEYSLNEKLNGVVAAYNVRIKNWDKNEPLIDLAKPVLANVGTKDLPESKPAENAGIGFANSQGNLTGSTNGALQEVVITSAYSTKRSARSMSSNVVEFQRDDLNAARHTNINNALAGKVAGLQVQSNSGAFPGSGSSVRLRGHSSLALSNKPAYVVNGTVVSDADAINLDDVEDVTVIQGPRASALYGADGANGAIVINLKKGKKVNSAPVWGSYKLSSMEDEDYLQQIKAADPADKVQTLEILEDLYKNNINFYFDMALYFFEVGYKQKAMDLLMDGVELSSNNYNYLTTASYILEKWNDANGAIEIYKNLLQTQPYYAIQIKRNMAFAYVAGKNYQEAVNILADALTDNNNYYDNQLKEMALADLNAIATVYKDKVNVSFLNQNLLKPTPVDLRIQVESGGYYNYSNFSVIEPDNTSCAAAKPLSKNGGVLNSGNYYGYNGYGWNNEYTIKNALKGKYRLHLDLYNNYYYGNYGKWVRVITYKNFQKENQSIETELICLDNQHGKVEFAEVNW